MTLKFACTCGQEFYISTQDESPRMVKQAREEANNFRLLHMKCGGTKDEELPHDWKV